MHAEDGFGAQREWLEEERSTATAGPSSSAGADSLGMTTEKSEAKVWSVRGTSGGSGRCLLAREEFFHDSQKILAGVAFRQDAVGAGGLNFVYGLIGVVDGEDQNFRSGGIAPYLTHGGEAIQDRHINVENDEIRVEFGGFIDGVLAIDRFAADFPRELFFEHGPKAATQHFVIVGNQDLLPRISMRGRRRARVSRR